MSTTLTIRKRIDSASFTKMIDINQISEDTKRSSKTLSLANSMSVCLLHVLDILLLIIITPYIFWQCASTNDRVKIIFRSVVEVTLELLMWVIFAGVSILMTTTFLLDDTYIGKNDNGKEAQLISRRNDDGENCKILDLYDFPREPEEPTISN